MKRLATLKRGALHKIALALCVLSLSGCVWLEVSRLNRMDLTEFHVEGERLYIANEINARSLDQFLAVMESAPQVQTLVFTVVPGSVDDEVNLEFGKEIRKRGLSTYLVSGGLIASGGVDLFLAGTERTLEVGSFVGVHSWAAGGGKTGASVPKDHPAHALYLDYYEAIDIAEEFYWFTLEAPAREMHWMSVEELQQYGVTTRPLQPSGAMPSGPFGEHIRELHTSLNERPDDAPVAVQLTR